MFSMFLCGLKILKTVIIIKKTEPHRRIGLIDFCFVFYVTMWFKILKTVVIIKKTEPHRHIGLIVYYYVFYVTMWFKILKTVVIIKKTEPHRRIGLIDFALFSMFLCGFWIDKMVSF
jgi:uncharacterized protein (UPF0335 family)